MCYVGEMRTANCKLTDDWRSPIETLREFLLPHLGHVDIFAVLDEPAGDAAADEDLQKLQALLAPHLVETHMVTTEEARGMYAKHVCNRQWNGSKAFALPTGGAVAQSAGLGRCWQMLTAHEKRSGFVYSQVIRVRPDLRILEPFARIGGLLLSRKNAEVPDDEDAAVKEICIDAGGDVTGMCLRECPNNGEEATPRARVLTLTPYDGIAYNDIFFAVERRVARHFFAHLEFFETHFIHTPMCNPAGAHGQLSRPALDKCGGMMPAWWRHPSLPHVFPDSRSCSHATRAKCTRRDVPPLPLIHEDLLDLALSLLNEPLRIVYLGYSDDKKYMELTRFRHVDIRETCEAQLRRYWPCIQGLSDADKVAWQAQYHLPVGFDCHLQHAAHDRECFSSTLPDVYELDSLSGQPCLPARPLTFDEGGGADAQLKSCTSPSRDSNASACNLAYIQHGDGSIGACVHDDCHHPPRCRFIGSPLPLSMSPVHNFCSMSPGRPPPAQGALRQLPPSGPPPVRPESVAFTSGLPMPGPPLPPPTIHPPLRPESFAFSSGFPQSGHPPPPTSYSPLLPSRLSVPSGQLIPTMAALLCCTLALAVACYTWLKHARRRSHPVQGRASAQSHVRPVPYSIVRKQAQCDAIPL